MQLMKKEEEAINIKKAYVEDRRRLIADFRGLFHQLQESKAFYITEL